MRPFHKHCILLVCMLLLTLSCHGNGENPEVSSQAEAGASDTGPGIFLLSREEQGLPPELAGLNEPVFGDFDEMVRRRLIRVLTVFQPGWYYLEGPRERGLTYEAVEQFEQFVNERQASGLLKVNVVLIPVPFEKLQRALVEGYGDIIAAGYTMTDARLQDMEFSAPLSRVFDEVIVTGPGAPGLETLGNLSGHEVYARKTSSHEASLHALSSRITAEGHAAIKVRAIPPHMDDLELLEMVSAGVLPIAAMDEFKARFWSQIFPDIAVRDDLVLAAERKIGWAFRKNSPLLAAELNEFARTHKQGSLTGNIIINRYQKNTAWVESAIRPDDIERFQTTVGFFRKYGPRYDLDPLLLAAQGYQESGLDQSARSPAGAIGIMQLLPGTAADPNVGIPDIENPESNIHAGAKYLRFIRDRYFDDPGISRLNQTLFAFAAYNAGPARITRLRAKAEDVGLDPNVWFDNVERLAAKEVGREPVQYVANIYKYYIAYSLLEEKSFPNPD